METQDQGLRARATISAIPFAWKMAFSRWPTISIPSSTSKFGHLFSERKFSHYRLRIEYRFVGDQCKGGPSWAFRNSGVMIHSQSPESMRKDQDFPSRSRFSFSGGNGKDERPTGNVCTPGTNIVMRDKLITQHCNRFALQDLSTATNG